MIQVKQEDSREKSCANNDAYNLCYDGEDVWRMLIKCRINVEWQQGRWLCSEKSLNFKIRGSLNLVINVTPVSQHEGTPKNPCKLFWIAYFEPITTQPSINPHKFNTKSKLQNLHIQSNKLLACSSNWSYFVRSIFGKCSNSRKYIIIIKIAQREFKLKRARIYNAGVTV